MNQKRLILTFCLTILVSGLYATEQETDLLIIGNDTVYLKTFPLEQLELENKPFGNTQEFAPSTACWRGYRAVWRIVNDSLFLEKIIRCYSDKQTGEQDIKKLFEKNSLDKVVCNDLVFADWYSIDLYQMTFAAAQYYKDRLYLYEGWHEKKKNKKLIMSIENGLIKINIIGQE